MSRFDSNRLSVLIHVNIRAVSVRLLNSIKGVEARISVHRLDSYILPVLIHVLTGAIGVILLDI